MKMCEAESCGEISGRKYKLVAPDGGWGYLILLAVIIFNVITIIPVAAFGLLFGKFLASIGDETSQTALTIGIYNTAQMFSGFITNFLLRKYSYRKVGLVGAFLYFLGSLTTVFAHNLIQMIICFSILEGLGCGFMLGAVYSSFNTYFNKKLNFVMGISHTVFVLVVILVPSMIAIMVENLGYTETLAALVCFSLLNIVSMGALQPVKWHMRKVEDERDETETLQNSNNSKTKNYDMANTTQVEPLLEKENEETKEKSLEAKIHSSLSNLGERVMSVKSLDREDRRKISVFDYRLITSPKFLNINFGIAFGVVADISFNALVPLLLGQVGFKTSQIAFMMTIMFGCDVVSRLLFSLVNAFYKTKNRLSFLIGCLLTAVFRIAFLLHDSYTWRLTTLGILGFLRCFIQTTVILVISDEYKENFPSALSLSMVLTGVTALTLGGLASLVKSTTGNDLMVVHLYTAANFLCVFCWLTELIYTKLKTRPRSRLENESS